MLTGLPDFPVPEGAVDGMLDVGHGNEIRYALFPATVDVPRGTVCLLNGRAEFIEKYFEVVGELRDRGFAVATMDWHGQGLSTRHVRWGRKGHVDSFATFEAELDTFVRRIVLPDCPPPFFGLGHSMGGHVLLRYARRGANPFDRIVLSAPMIAINFRRVPPGLIKAISELASLLGLAGLGTGRSGRKMAFEGNPLTRDRRRFDRMNALIEANPDLGVGAPTFGWLHAATVSSALELGPVFRGGGFRPGPDRHRKRRRSRLDRGCRDYGTAVEIGADAVDPRRAARAPDGSRRNARRLLVGVRCLRAGRSRAAGRDPVLGLTTAGRVSGRQQIHRLVEQRGITSRQDSAAFCRASAGPVADTTAGAGHDRDEGNDIEGLQSGFDDKIDEACGKERISVTVRAVSHQTALLFDRVVEHPFLVCKEAGRRRRNRCGRQRFLRPHGELAGLAAMAEKTAGVRSEKDIADDRLAP